MNMKSRSHKRKSRLKRAAEMLHPSKGREARSRRSCARRRPPGKALKLPIEQRKLQEDRRVSAVVGVGNGMIYAPEVVESLLSMSLHEVIIVLDESQSQAFEHARSCKGAIVINQPDILSAGAAHVLGAEVSTGEIVMFMPGDRIVTEEELALYIEACSQGTDVVLQDLSGRLPAFKHQSREMRVRSFLNRIMGREDLNASSLTELPHALSRRAIQCMGSFRLATPAKAHGSALAGGLKIRAVSAAPLAPESTKESEKGMDMDMSESSLAEEILIGDYLEALGSMMERLGPSLTLAPPSRKVLAARRNRR
ncbi:putative glycosyl transferase [Paenibacillus algicola]|uniref:Putative glycosyl transferase n=2 Tax=Paenibacillus algicola TaxID=2565926 RepID=A0A4P8XNK8_9BACL|nr:putative glycosyl transferase [Paenibacillus algicola]